VKKSTILEATQLSTRRISIQAAGIESPVVFPMLGDPVPFCIQDDSAIGKAPQRQRLQAKATLLLQLAGRADEKGLSLFAYLADLAPADVAAIRFLSLE
jgi:hypothetical protein